MTFRCDICKAAYPAALTEPAYIEPSEACEYQIELQICHNCIKNVDETRIIK